MFQFPNIGQNSDWGIFSFWISGQSLINKSCHNSRTSNEIEMKLGLVTKLEKINTATSKRFENDVMPASCESNSDLLSYTPTSKRTFKKPVQILVKECFLPKRCHIWFIFSEIQIPFSLKKDNSKNRSHFLCLSFI